MSTPDPEQQRALLTRLRRVEGQLRGVQGMIERGEGCADIAQQLAAARKALDRAFFEMMGCAMNVELDQASTLPDARARLGKVAETLARYG